MTVHPENSVIADIDALIDEQLKAGPHDDYNADYYPKCSLCHHDWHGIACNFGCCSCTSSKGEVAATRYVDQIESIRYSDDRNGVSYIITGGGGGVPRSPVFQIHNDIRRRLCARLDTWSSMTYRRVEKTDELQKSLWRTVGQMFGNAKYVEHVEFMILRRYNKP